MNDPHGPNDPNNPNDANNPYGPTNPHGPSAPNGPNEPQGQAGRAGQACPQCAAPRRPDGTPSCGCTRRASEALRDTRSAEAAAAEDFDPLRIRPYVELGGGEPDETIRLAAVPHAETARLAAVADGLEPAAPAPDADGRTQALVRPDVAPDTERPRRKRRTVLLAATGGIVAVAAAAGFAGGLFSYAPPQRDDALPQDVRASVPEESAPATTSAPAATVSEAGPAAGAPAPPVASPTAPPPPPPSASPTPSPSVTATPSRTAPTATPSSPTSAGSHTQRQVQVLHPGDTGREVTELQLRLRQLSLYLGPTNGDYDTDVENSVRTYQLDRGIKEDQPGVYGLATRAKLESETKEP